MKRMIFIIAVLALIILVGCERKYGYQTWINPDAECCGVKDPLNNLEWLKSVYHNSRTYGSQIATLDDSYYYFMYIFKNDSTNEDFIVTKEFYRLKQPVFNLYSCNGAKIDRGYYQDYDSEYANPNVQFVSPIYREIPPCRSCSIFFENHTLVDTIVFIYTNDLKK